MLDPHILKTARSASHELAEADRRALLARAEYNTAVRRLHLAGASLREIADALAVSHQRVQQIVNEAGGSWWTRVWRTRAIKRDAICTFCDRPPSEVAKLIAGPNVYICDACVAVAEREARGEGAEGARLAKVTCSFCGRRRPSSTARTGSAAVCGDCLRLARDILDHRGR
jgi:hypothetical protein